MSIALFTFWAMEKLIIHHKQYQASLTNDGIRLTRTFCWWNLRPSESFLFLFAICLFAQRITLCEELFAGIWFSFHPLNRFAVDEIFLVSTEAAVAVALMFATWNNKVATNSIANFFFRPRACANRRANHRSTRDFVLCINSFERFESNTHKSSNLSPFYNRRVSIFARDKSICDCWGWSGKEKDSVGSELRHDIRFTYTISFCFVLCGTAASFEWSRMCCMQANLFDKQRNLSLRQCRVIVVRKTTLQQAGASRKYVALCNSSTNIKQSPFLTLH